MAAASENRHFIIIQSAIRAVRAGRIAVSQLLRLLTEFNKVLSRVGGVLLSEIDTVRKGRVQRRKKLEDPISGKITSIQLHNLQHLENCEQECRELTPQGTNLAADFWQAPSLDDLAQTQSAQPMPDVNKLFGTWPGDPDDGFEKIVNDLRKRNLLMEFRP